MKEPRVLTLTSISLTYVYIYHHQNVQGAMVLKKEYRILVFSPCSELESEHVHAVYGIV